MTGAAGGTRRAVVGGVVVGAALLALVAALGARLGVWSIALERPAGTWAWTASRAAGVTAYLALTADMLFGLFVSSAAADRWIARGRSVEAHRFLSLTALWLTAAHALVLLGDRYVGFDVLDVLVPGVARERTVSVGVGILALWLAAALHASFSLRGRIGPRGWRALHYAAFAVFAMATAHGIAAGTDARAPWMTVMFLGAGGAVAALTAVRIARAIGATGRSARTTPALK